MKPVDLDPHCFQKRVYILENVMLTVGVYANSGLIWLNTVSCICILPQNTLRRDCNGKCIE